MRACAGRRPDTFIVTSMDTNSRPVTQCVVYGREGVKKAKLRLRMHTETKILYIAVWNETRERVSR